MEHIVGIKIQDKIIGTVGFITWGRIFHPVDSDELLAVVAKHTSKFGILHVLSIELCDTLQELAKLPYFYEALFEFSHNFALSANNYRTWKVDTKKAMKRGEEIYFLGLLKKQKLKTKELGGTITHGFWYSMK